MTIKHTKNRFMFLDSVESAINQSIPQVLLVYDNEVKICDKDHNGEVCYLCYRKPVYLKTIASYNQSILSIVKKFYCKNCGSYATYIRRHTHIKFFGKIVELLGSDIFSGFSFRKAMKDENSLKELQFERIEILVRGAHEHSFKSVGNRQICLLCGEWQDEKSI